MPPSRADSHPLRAMLERTGARTLEAPSLRVAPPAHPQWGRVVSQWQQVDLLVVSGAPSAEGLMRALQESDLAGTLVSKHVTAIGTGAVGVLRRAGVRVDTTPRRHTADDVVSELGELRGKSVLLIREEGAERGLPDAIVGRGARVHEAPGYRMHVDARTPEMERLTAERWDAVAFANPTAARYFRAALDERGLLVGEVLTGMTIAAAGPATALAAERYGMTPNLVAAGTLRALVAALNDRPHNGERGGGRSVRWRNHAASWVR